MRPRLRLARELDSDLVLAWANDPLTRAMSFDTRPIEPEEHRGWFQRSLGGDARRLFIAEDEQGPLGLVRLDFRDADRASAEVGIGLAPERRGQGLSAGVLEALIAEARASGVRRLVARIRQENSASQRAFARAGFTATGSEQVGEIRAVRYELALDEPSDGG